MRLISLQFGNFLRFKETPVLGLDGQGLVLIEGENRMDPTADSNGSGKSTLFDAITWAMFGETVRGFKGDEVVNEVTGEDCFVHLVMESDKGHEYEIARYRKHSDYKNKLLLRSGKRDISSIDPDETQAKINSLVGMDFDTFLNVALFGQGVTRHFPAMTDKEQKVIMEKLVGVEVVRRAYEVAKSKVADLETEIEDLADPEADTRIELLGSEIESMESEEAGFITNRNARVEALEDEIASLKANAPSVKEAKRKLEDAKKEVAAAEEVCGKANKSSGVVADDLRDAKADARVARERVKECEDSVAEAERLTSGAMCKHCGSEITSTSRDRHLSHASSALERARDVRDKAEARVAELEERLEKVEAEAKKARIENQAARNAYDDAKDGVGEAKAAQEKIETKSEEIKRVKLEKWTGAARLGRKREELVKETESVKKARKKADALRSSLDTRKFVVDMLSDKGANGNPPLKGLIFESVTPFLNKEVAHYSKYLTGGNITVEFSAQSVLKSGEVRDRFGVSAVNRHGSSIYKGQSQGEKRKVDICAALALQRLAASRSRAQLNIAFFDEVFESLDETACDAVIELLVAEKHRYSSLFVITHMEGLKAHFPRTWLVVKEKGFSRIVV